MTIGKKRKKNRPAQGQQQTAEDCEAGQQADQPDQPSIDNIKDNKEVEEEEEASEMSDEVAVTTSEAPAEIIPAKSEDKLEIEKEEAEKKASENVEQNETVEAAKSTEELSPKEESKEASEDKPEDAEKADDDENEKKDEETTEEGGKKKKKFKIPNIPKTIEKIRSKSQERGKNKDKAEGGEEGAKEGTEEGAEGAEEGAEGAGADNKLSEAKAKVKEALDNIHIPKMPKIHKPAFLKKKKEGGDDGGEKGEEDEKGDEVKDGEEGEGEGEGEPGDKKEEQNEGEEGEDSKEKKHTFMDNLKSMKNQVHMPAFLSKKSTSKEKDPEAGDKEESKELLEKKEGAGETTNEEGKEGAEETAEEGDEAPKTETEGKTKGNVFLDSLRSVASHVPSIFKGKQTAKTPDKDADVEAGEKDELLEKKEGDKPEGEQGELEEVKVISGDEEAPGKDEKKDPEKPDKPYLKYLNYAKDAKNSAEQKFNALDRQKQYGVIGGAAAFLLFLFIIILVAICTPSDWTNYARISEDGQFVTTHTSCGPVKGLVEGQDQFSFKRIPYAIPVLNTDRWTHSRPMTTLDDCHEGIYEAHGHNDSGSCIRRYPNGADGSENCLTLDIYTSSVVYNELQPVVVYIDGDDLSQEEEQALQPSASLAYDHKTVFVSVNYRRGVLGFLSLKSLSARSPTKSSGNYGMGDIIASLKWIQKNIQHFGGHPNKITILARGSGATLVTALTASPQAQDLFQQVWLSNGAGSFANKTLDEANSENKEILNKLGCGADEVECLVDATADDVTDSIPFEWRDTNQPELPQKGETDHSWIIIDKQILIQHPKDYWKDHQRENKITMVFGATAQGEVTAETKDHLDWSDHNKFEAHIESKLGSFNETLPGSVMEKYNVSDHWQEYASMISDIRTICPMQDLAQYVNENFVAEVFSYVATQPRSSETLGGIADKTIDISAILGTYQTEDAAELQFISHMQNMFYTYVNTGKLPLAKDLTLGIYVVNDELATQRNYPICDFWKEAQDIVPNYAALD